jgi:hypothetical protein
VEWLKVRPCTKPVPLKKKEERKKEFLKQRKHLDVVAHVCDPSY